MRLSHGVVGALVLAGACMAGAAHAQNTALSIYAIDSVPISYLDNGRPQGFAVDLAAAVLARLGEQVPIKFVPWARAIQTAEAQPNVLLLSSARSADRIGRFQYLGPIFTDHLSILTTKGRGRELRDIGDNIHKLRIGVRRGSIFVGLARKHGFDTLNETADSETSAKMLMSKRFDVWLDGEALAQAALRKAGYQWGDVDVVLRLGQQDVYFAFSPGTPAATVRRWGRALRDLQRDGAYQRMHRQWFPGAAPPPSNGGAWPKG